MNKIGILQADIFTKNFDIISVSETHLDDSINWAEIFPPEYIIYRRDGDRNGGGVLIAVKRNILSSYQENLVNTNIELLVIRIRYTNNKSLLFAVFYRPPSSDVEYLEQFQENMNSLEQNTDIILVGDFNLKEVDWNRNLMLNNSGLYEIFSDILLDNFVTQMVLQPTRAATF